MWAGAVTLCFPSYSRVNGLWLSFNDLTWDTLFFFRDFSSRAWYALPWWVGWRMSRGTRFLVDCRVEGARFCRTGGDGMISPLWRGGSGHRVMFGNAGTVDSAFVVGGGAARGGTNSKGSGCQESREAQLNPLAGRRRQQPKPGVSKPITAKPNNTRQKSPRWEKRKSA